MARIRAAVGLAVLAMWAVGLPGAAQGTIPAYTYVRDSGGQVWFIGKDGAARGAIPLYPATDEEINAIPSTGQWLVPKPDGSGLQAGPRPAWDTTGQAAAAPAPASDEPVVIKGSETQDSRAFSLKAGSYAVTWRASKGRGGNFIVRLVALEGATGRDVLVNTIVDSTRTGETMLHNLPGDSYLDVTAPGDWQVTFTAQ